MSLKLYQINTTLNHPDCMAGFKKNDDEIFSFFRLDIGNEEKKKKIGVCCGHWLYTGKY